VFGILFPIAKRNIRGKWYCRVYVVDECSDYGSLCYGFMVTKLTWIISAILLSPLTHWLRAEELELYSRNIRFESTSRYQFTW